MADGSNEATLAPIDDLIAILPKIEEAKERARLGSALQKATFASEEHSGVPSHLDNLSALLSATALDKDDLRAKLEPTLVSIINMGRVLSGDLTIEQLDEINQSGMTLLPSNVEKIERYIEELWKDSIQQGLGGQAALGGVLSAIPGLEALGRKLSDFAARTRSLENDHTPAKDRVAERDALLLEASALSDRLEEAGIESLIAEFLVAVAQNPVLLSDLTEEILAWIREHNALTLFSVSARGT